MGWWVIITLIVTVAVIAIVFALLAFGESQVSQPSRNIMRHDIVARGDLVVDGDARFDVADVESLHVHKSTTLNRLTLSNLRLSVGPIITDAGTNRILMSIHNGAYRVDSPAGSVVDLVLTPVSEAPGQLFQIIKSQRGALAQVNVLVSSGDFLCDNFGCKPSKLTPVITLLAEQPDQLWFSNDSVSCWKTI